MIASMRVLGGAGRVRTSVEFEATAEAVRDEQARQLDEVLEQNELRLATSERTRLLARLVAGGHQYGISDLRVVYSMMVAAGISLLDVSPPPGQYL